MNWYETRYDESQRWLIMPARTFGSAIHNYQQALDRFDRGIDSLSRRLATHIDNNIRFEKIKNIQGRLLSTLQHRHSLKIPSLTLKYRFHETFTGAFDPLFSLNFFSPMNRYESGGLKTAARDRSV